MRDFFLRVRAALSDFDLGLPELRRGIGDAAGEIRTALRAHLFAFPGARRRDALRLRPFDEQRCEMKRLYVRPGYRGKRLGDALIERFMRMRARSGHYQSVLLDTIQPLMSRAIAMYKKMGFREIPAYRSNPIDGRCLLGMQALNGISARNFGMIRMIFTGGIKLLSYPKCKKFSLPDGCTLITMQLSPNLRCCKAKQR